MEQYNDLGYIFLYNINLTVIQNIKKFKKILYKKTMSISTKLQKFKNSSRIVINDKFFGDQGASQLAYFLANHKQITSLQIKSNDISPQGFIQIFQALQHNPSLKQLNIQHNNLGINDYVQWHQYLVSLIYASNNLQRLNLSNNKIASQGFSKISQAIIESKSLKLVELRYNNIGLEEIMEFVKMMRERKNQVLLYVQFVGNKVKKQVLQSLQALLAKNRSKNPITKQKLMGNVKYNQNSIDNDRTHTLQRNNTVGILPYNNMTLYLQQILDQTRIDIAENKIKLQKQLVDLQKQQKLDTVQLNQFDKKCNQLIIINRNLKFQLDRTIGQYQQIQKDQQSHLFVHEEKLRQAGRQVQMLTEKYQQMENRMNKQHQLKMKQVVRQWEGRLRVMEEKIRITQNENNVLEGQIRKYLDRRERLKVQCIQQENKVRNRIQDEETFMFNIKIKNLQSKLRQIQTSRDGFIHRNQQLILEIEKSNQDNLKQISELQMQLADLKTKQVEFNAKSKDFFTKNQKIKADIQMKQITIQKLENEISRLDKQIELKKDAETQQQLKIKETFQIAKENRINERKTRTQRLMQAQNSLRLAQFQNAKLRQDFGMLAQKLQVNLNLAVHKVFQENSLY